MDNKQLNEKESLALIARMINNTQQRFQKENAIPFLVFGYVTVAVSIIIWYLLKTTGNHFWNLLWFSIPVWGFFGKKLFYPKREKSVRTFVDKAVEYIWMVLGACMILVSAFTFFTHLPILFEILLLIGIATILTGLITKMNVIVVAGIVSILSSILFLFGIVTGINQILVFGGIFFLVMVFPGHVLYYKGKK